MSGDNYVTEEEEVGGIMAVAITFNSCLNLNNLKFSTIDNDSYRCSGNCADSREGGVWWQ